MKNEWSLGVFYIDGEISINKFVYIAFWSKSARNVAKLLTDLTNEFLR